jgi:hypothetical protein
MTQRMSHTDNYDDAAIMTSLYTTLEKTLEHSRRVKSHDEARTAVAQWIEASYQ